MRARQSTSRVQTLGRSPRFSQQGGCRSLPGFLALAVLYGASLAYAQGAPADSAPAGPVSAPPSPTTESAAPPAAQAEAAPPPPAAADWTEAPAAPKASTDVPPTSAEDATLPQAYRVEMDRAFQEFEAGVYLEARVHFLEAHRVYPNARSLRALGQCEYELKSYASAIDLLQQALASTVRPLTEEARKETEDLIARARYYVASYELQTFPAGAHLTVDGMEVARLSKQIVLLSVGHHVVDADATGFVSRRFEIEVIDNAPRSLLLELTQVPEQKVGDDRARRKRLLIWGGAAAVVTAGVATALAVSLRSPRDPDGGSTRMVIQLKPQAPAASP